MRKTQTFEFTYNYFEPGTKVVSTSTRKSLTPGKVYTVTKCNEPLYYGDKCIVFFEGLLTGFSSEYLKEVDEHD